MNEQFESARVVARDGNLAVVQMPGRRFPALAIQGDTAYRILRDLQIAAATPDLATQREQLRILIGDVQAGVDFYAQVQSDRSDELPWTSES